MSDITPKITGAEGPKVPDAAAKAKVEQPSAPLPSESVEVGGHHPDLALAQAQALAKEAQSSRAQKRKDILVDLYRKAFKTNDFVEAFWWARCLGDWDTSSSQSLQVSAAKQGFDKAFKDNKFPEAVWWVDQMDTIGIDRKETKGLYILSIKWAYAQAIDNGDGYKANEWVQRLEQLGEEVKELKTQVKFACVEQDLRVNEPLRAEYRAEELEKLSGKEARCQALNRIARHCSEQNNFDDAARVMKTLSNLGDSTAHALEIQIAQKGFAAKIARKRFAEAFWWAERLKKLGDQKAYAEAVRQVIGEYLKIGNLDQFQKAFHLCEELHKAGEDVRTLKIQAARRAYQEEVREALHQLKIIKAGGHWGEELEKVAGKSTRIEAAKEFFDSSLLEGNLGYAFYWTEELARLEAHSLVHETTRDILQYALERGDAAEVSEWNQAAAKFHDNDPRELQIAAAAWNYKTAMENKKYNQAYFCWARQLEQLGKKDFAKLQIEAAKKAYAQSLQEGEFHEPYEWAERLEALGEKGICARTARALFDRYFKEVNLKKEKDSYKWSNAEHWAQVLLDLEKKEAAVEAIGRIFDAALEKGDLDAPQWAEKLEKLSKKSVSLKLALGMFKSALKKENLVTALNWADKLEALGLERKELSDMRSVALHADYQRMLEAGYYPSALDRAAELEKLGEKGMKKQAEAQVLDHALQSGNLLEAYDLIKIHLGETSDIAATNEEKWKLFERFQVEALKRLG